MGEISARQREILRHALGLRPDGSGRSYRHHFVTGPGSDDFDDCVLLVERGLMARRPGNVLTGGDDLFLVTDAGNEAARHQPSQPEGGEK